MATKRRLIVLWIFCIIGQLALVPYLMALGLIPKEVSSGKLILSSAIQGPILWGIVCLLSYWVLRKVDLQPFASKPIMGRIVYPGLLAGVFLGLLLFMFEKIIFPNSVLSAMQPPAWAGALASIYGGINEEVLMRLFFLSLVYLALNKLFKNRKRNRMSLIWTAIILAAIVFSAGHLMTGMRLASLSGFEVFRLFLLNGIPGLLFGWLYCTNGFWAAALAHFTTDLMIHVLLIPH